MSIWKQAGDHELRFVPHGALIDSELGSLDVIKALPIGTMIKPNNFVFSVSGAGNNWATGFMHKIHDKQVLFMFVSRFWMSSLCCRMSKYLLLLFNLSISLTFIFKCATDQIIVETTCQNYKILFYFLLQNQSQFD